MSYYIDNFADDLGPEKVVHIYEPKSKLRAIVVIDNISLGPAIGGCRMARDVSTQEVFRLARAMTLKNALAQLPHGGAKSAILADSGTAEKEALVRGFAQAIKTLTDYIPGPDMGTDEESMAFVLDEIGRAVGLPKVLGGIPLDSLGMTGYGLSVAGKVAADHIALPLEDACMVVQGFGNVGKAAAKYLGDLGVKLIATSDSKGGVHNPDGIDVPALVQAKESGTTVAQSGLGKPVTSEDLLKIESDIFIPAARPDVFTETNQDWLKTRLVLEGANIPITHEAAKRMHKRGIMIIPDVIANSGGVICAATEYQRLNEANAFDRVEATVSENTAELLKRVVKEAMVPHDIAQKMARERIDKAMSYRAHM
jgi:glutamate dehydrogenase (NAD(P)+)/glutamate dehydrogenase (NADP+)